MAAGPDGFHQPSPIPHIEQQSVLDKARGVSVLGLTNFHHFIGLANSCRYFVVFMQFLLCKVRCGLERPISRVPFC